ncbi:hypothetical protein GGI23_004571 [Coemansia sp. RSA 2559]|nr:hypothetical protein GGI23_004571 [Coemansia sp. RSA 2559]
MVLVLDYGEYHVQALVNITDKDSVPKSNILRVFREVHDYDRYPKAGGRVGLSSAPEKSILKIPSMIKYNSWKYATKSSIDREIKTLETLQHPNIMKLFGLFVEDGFVKGLYVPRYDYTLDQLL